MSFLSPYRREVLVLYRDILKASRAFTWVNEDGKKWGDVLKESARSEFEANRHIENTEEIARLLYIGNDALSQAMQKASEKAQGLKTEK